MIRFKDTPSDERAHAQILDELKAFGYVGEEAQRIADASCSVTIGLLRSMDGMIETELSDDIDRTIAQQLVMSQLMGISKRAMEANAFNMLLQILGGRR